MKRLFIGLTLLLMTFFSTLDHVGGLYRVGSRFGVQRWMAEMVLATAMVALFARACQLHRRMLHPRRGLRMLVAGIALYGLALGLNTGLLATAFTKLSFDESDWAGVPHVLAQLPALPFCVAAWVLLIAGAFRALTNLVPPDEFAEDF